MPQAGSLSAISANASAAFAYPNEWRMATALLNPGLHGGVTGNGKVYLAKLSELTSGVLVLGNCRRHKCQARAREHEVQNACQSHFDLPPGVSDFISISTQNHMPAALQSAWPRLRVRCGLFGGSADRSDLLPGAMPALPHGMMIPQRPVRRDS
jgi:hypothetical protein